MRSKIAACIWIAAVLPAGAGTLDVRDGWFRALPPAVPSGGYFTLVNGGTAPVTLTGAESPACGMLMLHKSENMGGMTGMADVSAIDVAGGGKLVFAPGGYHLMCMHATGALKPGATVPVTLHFKDGQKLTAPFAVRDAAGK